MVFWKKIFNFFWTTCNAFRLSCRVVKEGNEGKCKAKRRKGEKHARGERREWERAKRRPGRLRRSPLSLLPLPECPPYLCVPSRCTRCSERATSLARSTHYGSPPYVWGEMPLLVRVEARTEGQSNALSARILAFVRSLARSFVLLFTVGKASRWIRVNAVRLTLIRRRSSSERHHRSSMLNLSTPPTSICWLYSLRSASRC